MESLPSTSSREVRRCSRESPFSLRKCLIEIRAGRKRKEGMGFEKEVLS